MTEEKIYSECDVKCIDDINYITQEGMPITGIIREHYPSGALLSEKRCINGQLNGAAKYYSETGNLVAETNYKNGMEDGISRCYDEAGNLIEEITFKNGLPVF